MNSPFASTRHSAKLGGVRGGQPMRDPLSRSFSFFQSSQESWLNRVRDNFHQLLTSVRISPSSASDTPIHLLRLERSPRGCQAQSISLFVHTTTVGALALLTFQPTT